MASSVLSCRWDWCRSSFSSIDTLDAHVKRDHIWPMKPMRKADITLLRRMDLQSLHSSAGTDSSIISRGISSPSVRSALQTSMTPGLTAAVSCTPPPIETPKRQGNKEFDSFAELSSPLPTHSPDSLPDSPAFESLIKQDGRSRLLAAVEMFKQTIQRRRSSLLRSPSHRPLSQSSGSSQEVVEQQLTQDDVVSRQLLIDPQIKNDLANAELRWPTDDEQDIEEIREPVSGEDHPLGSSPDPARGLNFRTGSLNVPLRINGTIVDSQSSSQGSQQFVLQTQAPYWSQSQ